MSVPTCRRWILSRAVWARLFGVSLLLVIALAVSDTATEWLFLAYLASVTPDLWRIDLAEYRLPNGLVLPGYAVGFGTLFCQAVRGESLLVPVVSCVLTLVLFAVVYGTGGMGMGDLKLAGVLGTAAGMVSPQAAVMSPLLAFASGGGCAVFALLSGSATTTRIPFGPFLLAGFWGSLVLFGSCS